MIGRIHSFFRRCRKRLSRSEWSLHLLGLSTSPEAAIEPGVVLIQVDGLSLTQARKGLGGNSLPFVAFLLKQHKFSLRSLYTGMPSTTPAVQGELFFGIKTAVPAFEFIERSSDRRFAMYSADAAEHVAKQLSASGEHPLLSGGSSYGNVYTAGAAEARYCAQTMKLQSLLRSTNIFRFLFILLLHLPKFVRIFGVACLEFFLSLSDFFRGISSGKNLAKELKFIPTRVFVCIMLRELIRFRVKMDVARGVPVVHANLIGYDEQSHRRGPNSKFAHWTLQGIDGVIKDIYRTALRSDCRAYRLVVYSDHGQEYCTSYRYEAGRTLEEAVQELAVLHGLVPAAQSFSLHREIETVYLRARDLLLDFRKHSRKRTGAAETPGDRVAVTTMGPLGHVYFPTPISDEARREFARDLVQEAGIPLVFFQEGQAIKACKRTGTFDLKTAPSEILGPEHPFVEETAVDLQRLCMHENAGDLVLSGWLPHQTPLSFSIESGAHGGPGREETRGFVLLPSMVNDDREFLRPLHIREHVLELLHSHNAMLPPVRKERTGLQVLTYNIHGCRHMDGKINPRKTGEIINAFDADILALQEVDVHKQRSGGLDQARFLAEYLQMEYSFFPVHISESEYYGLALLTRYPVIEMKKDLLPDDSSRSGGERRGAMLALIETPQAEVWVLNTHLGLGVKERRLQMQALLGPEWLEGIKKDSPIIFCGDINAGVRSRIYRDLSDRLTDVQVMKRQKGYPRSTFSSFYPMLRLDHIFVSSHWRPAKVEVPEDRDTRSASDHLPLFAELQRNVRD